MSLLIALIALLGAIYLCYTTFFHFAQNRIPSAHYTSPFTSLWLTNLRRGGKTGIKKIIALHVRHGPIIRLSPSEISVASVEGLRTVYTGGFEKDEFYSQFANYEGTRNMVSMLGNKEHAVRKKMLNTVYTKSFIQSSVDVEDLSTRLIYGQLQPALRSVVEGGERNGTWGELDAYTMNLALGADFTSAFLLGVANGTGFIQNLAAGKMFLNLWKIKARELPGHEKATQELEALIRKLATGSRDGTGNVALGGATGRDGIVRAHLQSRLDGMQEKSTELEGKESRKSTEEKIIASELLDHLIAGIETTRITLIYLQHELSLPHNASLQTSLRIELRTLSKPVSLSSPTAEAMQLPSAREIDDLPLLDAILKETLRLYPPSPAPLPRVVPQGGTTLHGFFIPAGIVIGTSSHVLHQNPSVFEEPRTFRPMRWIVEAGDQAREEKLRDMNRNFWPFGSGARMCIGNHFAIYILKLITAAFYTSFETCILGDEGIEQEDAFLAGPVGEKLILGLRVVE